MDPSILSSPTQTTAAANSTAPTKILLIEDDDSLRFALAERLSLEGFSVATAGNGLEGIVEAKTKHPDLVLCDITMPGIDGYAVMKELRECEATAEIPILFLSGKTEQEEIRHAMHLGADDYICKPVVRSDMMAAIRTRLERTSQVRKPVEKAFEEIKTDLVSSLSHEFNTILTGISAPARLLESMEDYGDTEEVRTLASYIAMSADRLGDVIRRFLCYADLLLNPLPHRVMSASEPHIAPLKTTVESVSLKLAKTWKREADLVLGPISGTAKLPMTMLSMLIEVILDNAFKFSAPGSKVEVSSQKGSDRFTVSIVDHGHGMTQAQIESVGAFRQFERRRFEQQGVGLGLEIARMICNRFGGSLRIESELRQGCRVEISFPEGSVTSH